VDEGISTCYGIPQCFDCLNVLGKADSETWGAHSELGKKTFPVRTVDFFVVLHEEEWVEIEVAKKGNVGPEWDDDEGEQICHSNDTWLTLPASSTCTWLEARV
jgi:hypothetical protein